ncbi:hypothetical protein Taro_023834 [Colocasia esculenta]|uniref:Uncharacterized protein n=1 Tax=Colocasia esculenta TaxID=4460 RepID=A0A843V4S3_COLES|nr:hypothetical protein [Colocasia esculenta]
MKCKRRSKSRMGMRPSDERSNYESSYGASFRTCWGRVEELLVAEELWNDHKKLIFFPYSSTATCTNRQLEVGQSLGPEAGWLGWVVMLRTCWLAVPSCAGSGWRPCAADAEAAGWCDGDACEAAMELGAELGRQTWCSFRMLQGCEAAVMEAGRAALAIGLWRGPGASGLTTLWCGWVSIERRWRLGCRGGGAGADQGAVMAGCVKQICTPADLCDGDAEVVGWSPARARCGPTAEVAARPSCVWRLEMLSWSWPRGGGKKAMEAELRGSL